MTSSAPGLVASELTYLFSSSSRVPLLSLQMSELFPLKAGVAVVEEQSHDFSS